jgi:hypothetical protein
MLCNKLICKELSAQCSSFTTPCLRLAWAPGTMAELRIMYIMLNYRYKADAISCPTRASRSSRLSGPAP